MTVESAAYISGLVPSYPPGSDNISEGDDHLRLIKSVLQGTFPNANAAVNGIHTGTSAPTSTSAGLLWYDTTTSHEVLKIRNSADGGWIILSTSPAVDFKLLGATNVGWVLPTADGSANQYLKTDASGNLDWASPAGAELPSQTGNSGKFLTTDGSAVSWAVDNSAFGGAADGYRSFSATKGGTNQTGVATATATKVTWPTIDWQTSTGTPFASDKFTCDLAGKYHFYTAVKFTTDALYDNEIRFHKNGSIEKYANYFIAYDSGANTGKPTMQLEASMSLSVSDYIEVYVHQESGGDLIIDGTATASWFTGYRIE